jgi:transcriptional regulator GlxA family with amidase domain
VFKLWDTRPVVGVVMCHRVELLEFFGPYEVFSGARSQDGKPLFRVHSLAARPEVSCGGGLKLAPDRVFAKAPGLDILVLPGGPGAAAQRGAKALLEFVAERAATPCQLASVGTGAFLLARCGLLAGKQATTHWAHRRALAKAHPQVEVVRRKVVDQGKVVTAAGGAAGVDLALFLVEKYYGAEARRLEARRLEGPWR